MASLIDVPPEILRRVCDYALPRGWTFSFRQDDTEDNREPTWSIYHEIGSSRRKLVSQGPCLAHKDGVWCRARLSEAVYTAGALQQVSKSIAAEARGRTIGLNS